MQFAGSSSTGDRRRRRLVVNGDGSAVDTLSLDGESAGIESQLVASAAAAPWVPVNESRIWIYAFLIGVLLTLLTYASVRPVPLPAELNGLVEQLLKGPRPRILRLTQALFLGLSTQLGLLIGWYRSRCTLDFSGRYRVWPWAVALLALATFCHTTDFHLILGEAVHRHAWLTWRGSTVAWLLPFCVLSLPITLLVDRDVRSHRSSLFTLRFSGLLWLAGALTELFQPELQSRPWFGGVRQILPIFASATLFLGLWLHARIVAYVCPDPPKLVERSAWAVFLAGCRWLFSSVQWRKKAVPSGPLVEEVAKPKRRRRKSVDDDVSPEVEEAVVKRKRKPPAKRTTTRTRTKLKPPDPETEVTDEEATPYDDSGDTMEASEVNESLLSSTEEREEWNEEPEDAPSVSPSALRDSTQGNGRFHKVHENHSSSVPTPHVKALGTSWDVPSETSDSLPTANAESSEDSDEDQQLQRDSGLTSDQMKGLSKRQRRELKKQQRDQERIRGR